MLTDRKAIFIALRIAIDTEEALIDAYRGYKGIDETEPGVIGARKNIKAFKRVIERYYPEWTVEKVRPTKTISVFEAVKGIIGND